MSAQSIPKKMKQQSILNIMKSKKVDEKNVGQEPAGLILSDQLKSEIKEFVAKEFCVMKEAMKEEYEIMFTFEEVFEKLEIKDSEIQELKSRVNQQGKHISKLIDTVCEMKQKDPMKDSKLGVDGASLAPEEVEQLKGVIRRTKREEQSYWNRSIRISNLDQVPKEGSRFSNIQNILRKKGLEFLIKHCESYFLYNDKASSSSVRITFKTYQERNYYMIRARNQLRDLENKSIWLDNMVSPEFVAKKKELIHLGQTLKTEGEIVKFSVEMRQGLPRLKVITKESKVAWVDETSCDPNLSVST